MDILSKTILYSDEACRFTALLPGNTTAYAGFQAGSSDDRKIIDHMIKNPSADRLNWNSGLSQDGSVRNIPVGGIHI